MPAPDPSPLFEPHLLDDLTAQLRGDDISVVTGEPAGVYVKLPDGWRLAR